jgi:hypothetical protein
VQYEWLVSPSNVNAPLRVPTVALAVTVVSWETLVIVPTDAWHAKDVLEDHDAVEQACDATSADAVRSDVRKFTPVTVTMPPAVVTIFEVCMKLTTGAIVPGQDIITQ